MSASISPLELLAPALDCERPLLKLCDLQRDLDAGVAQLWTRGNSAIYTRIEAHPDVGEQVMVAGPAGGDMAEILAFVPDLERQARLWGCTQTMVIMGRNGWQRPLAAMGYKFYSTTVRKILTNG